MDLLPRATVGRLAFSVLAFVLLAAGAYAGAGALVGTWKLVDQEGYPEGQPKDVEQRMTFEADGTLRSFTRVTVEGKPTEQEQTMRYRVDGDRLILVLENFEMPARHRIEDGRLVVEKSGRRDIYERSG